MASGIGLDMAGNAVVAGETRAGKGEIDLHARTSTSAARP